MLSPMPWLFNKCPALKYCHSHVFPDAEIFFCNLHKSQILRSFSRKRRFFCCQARQTWSKFGRWWSWCWLINTNRQFYRRPLLPIFGHVDPPIVITRLENLLITSNWLKHLQMIKTDIITIITRCFREEKSYYVKTPLISLAPLVIGCLKTLKTIQCYQASELCQPLPMYVKV